MKEKNYGGYISKLKFNNDFELPLNKNDIVLFVGPNNAGKSQSIKDIYSLCEKKINTTVIKDIEVSKYEGDLINCLETLASAMDNGNYLAYSILGNSYIYNAVYNESFHSDSYFGKYKNLFVANLDTNARLEISNPAQSIALNASKNNPIHYAAFDGEYREWLSINFKKAFGTDIIPNSIYGSIIPLCMGEPVKLDGQFSDEQSRLEEYRKILSEYRKVHDQGDGIKSFTGILLYLMLKHYCIYCIDEPESFLHPPQAKIIGQIIGNTLSENQQAFISTHSESFINGILESNPNRVKIIRITRDSDKNNFAVLSNDKIKEIWKDPLLRHSNILSSLFYKTVVLCESDSDCKFYSIIEEFLKEQNGNYSESLFIHCGGKQRAPKILKALHSLNIDVRTILDLDVLNNETLVKELIKEQNIVWNDISNDYKILISNINGSNKVLNRKEIKSKINLILDNDSSSELTRDEIKELEKILSVSSAWKEIKKSGISALPPGDAKKSFNKINDLLKDNRIHIVPVGELEGFVKEIGNHGPEWVNSVLENYPDFNDSVYDNVKKFIAEINL